MKSIIPSSGASTRELRLAAGGPWCSRRVRDAGRLHRVASLTSGRRGGRGGLRVDDDVLDGRGGGVAARARSGSRAASRSARRERRDHDVIDAEQLQRVERGGVGIGVADHARAEQAGRAEAGRACSPAARAPRAARRPLPSALRHDGDEQAPARRRAAFAFRCSISSSPLEVLLATTSVTLNGRPSCSMSTTMCSTGSPVAFWIRSIRSRRSQPELRGGVGRDDDLVRAALRRPRPSSPRTGRGRRLRRVASMPSAATAESARSTRTCADSRTASS